jgi:hypothetical protein
VPTRVPTSARIGLLNWQRQAPNAFKTCKFRPRKNKGEVQLQVFRQEPYLEIGAEHHLV